MSQTLLNPLPQNALFLRVATLSFVGKTFQYPPFDLEFDTTLGFYRMNQTTAKLYNPNPETIKALEKNVSRINGLPIYSQCQIDAGYQNQHGLCVNGYIHDYKVSLVPPDRVLEIKISEIPNAWATAVINKTFKNTTASACLKLIAAAAGMTGSINVGTEKKYGSITLTTLYKDLLSICRDTGSMWTMANGTLTVTPANGKQLIAPQATLINKNSGLLGQPELTINGHMKFKALFLYQLNAGDKVRIQSQIGSRSETPIDSIWTILAGKKKFSTFSQAESEYEVVAG